MATVNVRVDDALKHDVERVLEDIGLSLSSAISIYFKQIVRENGVPFLLKASNPPLKPTPEFAAVLEETEADIAHKRNLSSAFTENELFNHLKTLRK